MAATADGFVAVGYRSLPGEGFFGRREGVVWRSADGLTWQRDVPAAFARTTLEFVVSLGSATYAFGVVSSCPLVFAEACTDDADAGNTVWRSIDGGDWQELPQWPSLVDAFIDGVTVGDGRLIVFGGSGDDLAPALWMSTDGGSWTEQGQLGDINPVSAFAAGPAGFVALGTRYNSTAEELEAVAVYSVDGSSFAPASVPAGISAAIEDVTYGDAGWVAVGYGDGLAGPGVTPVTLTSADGSEWAAAEAQPELAGVGFHRVATVPGGYVAIGFDLQPPDYDREQATSFYSRDGASWATLGALEGAQYTDFRTTALGDRGMTVFVAEHDELGDDDVINKINGWFAPIEALTIP